MTVRKAFFMIFVTVPFLCSQVRAQESSSKNIRRNVAAVLFSTLGGAVLGLSTLPFYGEPQEHTDNINVGALVGFVAGVGYVTYKSQQPALSADYGLSEEWQKKKALAATAKAPMINIQFEF